MVNFQNCTISGVQKLQQLELWLYNNFRENTNNDRIDITRPNSNFKNKN